jgi:hypothetical protein
MSFHEPPAMSLVVLLSCLALTGCRTSAKAAGKGLIDAMQISIEQDVAIQDSNDKFCWFHPRAAALPKAGRHGNPRVILTLNQHMDADDHYSGLWYMYTDDMGKTWNGPFEPKELGFSYDEPGIHASFHDVTPGWHRQTKKLLAIGAKTSYNANGSHANDKPGRIRTCYAVYDVKTDTWTPVYDLDVPKGGLFDFSVNGSSQWLEKQDGTVLIPVYYTIPAGSPGKGYGVVILECSFDGKQLHYLRHGKEIVRNEEMGFTEASLIASQGKYYLTLRGEVGTNGFVGVSDDGMDFNTVIPWVFDDGTPLGSVNTQQHWLAHQDGLFICYTRSGANNSDIPRSRAPLFIAQVDTKTLCAVRASERELIPNRGLMLGNFGAAPITSAESWVTDAEFLWFSAGYKPTARGGNGAVWVSRVKWPTPNRLAPR